MSELNDDYYDGTDYCNEDNGFLAVSSVAAPICESHIRMCRKVPLLCSLLGLANFIDG